MNPKWLEWATQLQAIAQNGLTFSQDLYDIERYQTIRAMAAEMIATYSDLDLTRINQIFGNEYGYATPKVDVRAAVFKDDKILVVREADDGGWSLPGGWADVNDLPSAAVVREIWEEAGYKTRVIKLIALYDRNHPRHAHPPYLHHVYKIFFECALLDEVAADSAEMLEVAFFSEAEISNLPLSLTRVTLVQIKRLFEHHHNPNLPTDFD